MRARSSLASSAELVALLNLVGESASFRDLLEQIDRFAQCDATILIHGETGTGKELAGRAIHYLSRSRNGPFIPINCGSIPDSLIGSEFFGYSRGAFTDARESRRGLIAQAHMGTLFLDELEAMSIRGQVALLRFLQDHEYRPLGASNSHTANVRVIGATNADLSAMCDRSEFRRDLFYRMNGLSVFLPPLRERDDDVILLARTFLTRISARYDEPPRELHPDAIATLKAYHWPGNVRELENLVHREFLLSDEPQLRFDSLRRELGRAGDLRRTPPPAAMALTDVGFREAKARVIADFERAYILELLRRARGNVSLAARLSGKERSRLGRLVRKYRLSAREFKSPAPDHSAS